MIPASHTLLAPPAQNQWQRGGSRGNILKYEAPQPFGRGAKVPSGLLPGKD